MSTLLDCKVPLPNRAPAVPMHVVWVNQHAALIGGCEQYILETVRRLNAVGVRNSLLYEVDGQTNRSFLSEFESAFPLVSPSRQVAELQASVGYVHRLHNESFIDGLGGGRTPFFRFYHDHGLFCLREHKYTTIGQKTCDKQVGLGCYACLGFAQRSENWPNIQFRSVGGLRQRQRSNHVWAGHIVGSHYMADHLALHGFASDRIHINPLYAPIVDDPVSSADDQRVTNLIGFAGQLVRGKGVDVLLHAMTRLENSTCLEIAGTGRQEAELKKLSASLGLGSRVQFLGRLDANRLTDFYRRVAIVAMPSRAPETFGLAGLEAHSHATPVIASNIGGISTWLEHGVNGLLVPPNDASKLAVAITDLLENPKKRMKMGRAGQDNCRRSFSPQQHLNRLVATFEYSLRSAAK